MNRAKRTRRPATSTPEPQTTPPHHHQRCGHGCDPLLTVDEVLALLRVSKSTWYQWRQAGHAPPAVKLPNGQLRIRRTALATWLETREHTTP